MVERKMGKKKNRPPILYEKWLSDHKKELTAKEALEGVSELGMAETAIDNLPIKGIHKGAVIFAYAVDIFWTLVKGFLLLFLLFSVFIAIVVLFNADLRNYLIDAIFYFFIRFSTHK